MNGLAASDSIYYISHGQKCKMHTLRETYTVKVFRGDSLNGGYVLEHYDHYVCNLSTDEEKAKAKAEEIVGKPVAFHSHDLDEITRRTSEEKAAYDEALAAKRIQEQKVRQAARNKEGLDELNAGRWPFGQMKGYKFEEAKDSYIAYFANQELQEETPENIVFNTLVSKLQEKFPHLLKSNLPDSNGLYFGEIGKRQEIKATLVEYFSFEGFYGLTRVYKFIAESGESIVYMGSGFLSVDDSAIEVGKVYSFSAGIKEHSEYKEEKQTKIQRITKLKKA